MVADFSGGIKSGRGVGDEAEYGHDCGLLSVLANCNARLSSIPDMLACSQDKPSYRRLHGRSNSYTKPAVVIIGQMQSYRASMIVCTDHRIIPTAFNLRTLALCCRNRKIRSEYDSTE